VKFTMDTVALPQVCLPVLGLAPVSVIAPKFHADLHHQICSSKKSGGQ
jgi:hypothetical protein